VIGGADISIFADSDHELCCTHAIETGVQGAGIIVGTFYGEA